MTHIPAHTDRLKIIEVNLFTQDVKKLVAQLDAYQIALYGIQHCNLESIEALQKNNAFVLGAFSEDKLAGIGAVKLAGQYGEIKRMYVDENHRVKGVAEAILVGLETYVKQQGRKRVALETGNLQDNALHFYKKHGYSVIEKFGDYQPNRVSVYFSKKI